MRLAVFPGTFDPITLGHIEIVRRGAQLFDRVVVAVGARLGKNPLFSVEDRVALAERATAEMETVSVAPFEGLIVSFARDRGATVLLRGLRNGADFEYEQQMALTNRHLAPELETVLLVASPDTGYLSSTLVKEVVQAGGAVDRFVPAAVVEALQARR